MRRGSELREVDVLRDASILLEDGMIVQVGSSRRLDNLKDVATARVLDARNLVIVPGFLDAAHDLLPLNESGKSSAPSSDQEEQWDSAFELPADYSSQTLNTVVRRLERELGKLSWAGTAFAQFRLRFPEQPVLQSRILRNLLQLDLPLSSFRVDLHFHELPNLDANADAPLSQQLSPAAKGYWKRLEPSLAVSIRSGALRGLSAPAQLHAIRRIRCGLPCYLTSPESLEPDALLAVSGGSGSTVIGMPPARREMQEAAARLDVPWVAPGSEFGVGRRWQGETLRGPLDAGMRLALSSGYDVNRPGCASPFALMALLRQDEKLEAEEILQLSIANLAYALGVGHRMGSIQAGHEGNLTILECDDYREIGMHLGLPPILASFRRGILMERRLPTRG